MLSQPFATPLVLAALALGGCADEAHQQHVVPTSSPGVGVANERAVAQLAEARCEREAQCHNLGNGNDVDKRTCTAHLGPLLSKAVSDKGCGRSLDKTRLDKCVAALQNEECEEHMGTLDDFDECKAVELCGAR